ncbi:MAG: NACHT domain-containing protein [Candidatus Odinarchaeota archaeon]
MQLSTSAIKEFKNGDWYSKCEQFVICTSDSLNKTHIQKKFNELKQSLKKDNVKLIKWDNIQIARLLKAHPKIVFDFFGREWVKIFNGEEKLNAINNNRKLDVYDVYNFRQSLFTLYSTVFQQHDPGIPSHDLLNFPCPIQGRFILPDVFKMHSSENIINPSENGEKAINEEARKHTINDSPGSKYSNKNYLYIEEAPQPQKFISRINIDELLPQSKRLIIIGDPGSGKSTLLRNIVLDLLSPEPKFKNISNRWGTLLPIWLPFAFITKNLNTDQSLSLTDLIRLWFKSIDKLNIYPLVEKALNDERLLLIIDGIDEWTNIPAAEQAISRIEIQSRLNNTNIIYSSRPFGFKLLKDSLAEITELNLAPFSKQQQKQFILFWYERWTKIIKTQDKDFAENETKSFMNELEKAVDFGLLAENPLLLSILLVLRLNDSVLPRNKIKAYETITNHLISKHPLRRKTSASIIEENQLEFDLNDIFTEIAFHMQVNSHEGTISKKEGREVIENFLVRLMHYETPKAKKLSNELLDIGANSIGIIIEKSNLEFAFIHRQFQEFLAAKYIAESERSEIITILKKFAHKSSWHQVIKYFFGLIPLRNGKDFKDYLNTINAQSATGPESVLYITYLKYELVLNLHNSPIDLAKNYLQKIIYEFEFDTNRNSKSIYWKIILESIYNPKIKDEALEFLFRYYPNFYQFSDYRLISIRVLSVSQLSQIQKEFLLKSIINGNHQQKLDASNTIQHFITDSWLQSQIFQLLDNCSNPSILAYILNCVITENITEEKKLSCLEKFELTEHPNLSFFSVKLKIHLKMHDNIDFDKIIKLSSNIHYSLKPELLNILSKGWSSDDRLYKLCLSSIIRYYHADSQIDSDLAWNILFRHFNHKKEVVDRIIEELQKEKYPFLGFDKTRLWATFSNYFRDNERLIPVIEEWILKQEFNEPEIAYASMLSKTNAVRDYLLNGFQRSSVPQWFGMALIQGWGKDEKVRTSLKDYFRKGSKNHFFAAHLISEVFADQKDEGIQLLKKILFTRDYYFRDRAISPLIELDKQYFEKNVLDRLIRDELDFFSKSEFGQYFNALDTILENFKDQPYIKKYCIKNLKNSPQGIDLLIRYYPEENELIDEVISKSLPLDVNYRIQLLEKFGERSIANEKILNALASYKEEAEETLYSTAAIQYFKYLYRTDVNQLISICSEDVFARGLKYEVQRQTAFFGYLIAKKLNDYFEQYDKDFKRYANPHFLFDTSHQEISSTAIQLLIENFEHLNLEVKGDFKKLYGYSEIQSQNIWGFWAKYSGTSSSTYPYIIDFINKNIDSIDNVELLDFLRRTAPMSSLLKNIALRLIDTDNSGAAVYSGKLIGEIYGNSDLETRIIKNLNEMRCSDGKIVALCIGWPRSSALKMFYKYLKANNIRVNNIPHYYLGFHFCNASRVVSFLDESFRNYKSVIYDHSSFIDPLMRRIKKDNGVQQILKQKLLNSQSITSKISIYSIFSMLNLIDSEIVEWKQKQYMKPDINAYGYNILTNEIIPFTEVLFNYYDN